MLWPRSLSKKIITNVNLARFTSFKIGGQAEYFFEPKNTASLQLALRSAQKAGLPIFILGAGSNILIAQKSLKGLVIRLSSEFFQKCSNQGNYLVAFSGLKLNQLILFAAKKNLKGIEFLAGIPGTLGGALMGNAGAWGESIGELVQQVRVLDYQGKPKLLTSRHLKFTYRQSNLDKYIILWAKLKLSAGDQIVIRAKIKEYLFRRRQTQNNRLPNAGCIFKNPRQDSAGRLIDLCGIKGEKSGGAVICSRHANFILNRSGAKSQDVLALMDLMQRKVKTKFKVKLEPEIKIWK